jgi:hypothetical protein
MVCHVMSHVRVGDLKVQKRAWKEADGSVWDEKFGHKQTLVP